MLNHFVSLYIVLAHNYEVCLVSVSWSQFAVTSNTIIMHQNISVNKPPYFSTSLLHILVRQININVIKSNDNIINVNKMCFTINYFGSKVILRKLLVCFSVIVVLSHIIIKVVQIQVKCFCLKHVSLQNHCSMLKITFKHSLKQKPYFTTIWLYFVYVCQFPTI